ncbi:MAG: imelysin family protein, partial [Flavitalea sp.]
MKIRNSIVVAVVVVMCIILVFACKKTNSDPQTTTFDQRIMLANYSDNIIVPAYTSLAVEADKLVTASNTFSTTPTTENLVNLQHEFTLTYKAWMHCEPFNFGPADDVVMLETAISFPAKPDLIETELSGTSEFTDAYVHSWGAQKKGLAALAYLLFVRNDDDNASAAHDKFVSGANGDRRKLYAAALAKNIAANAHTVLDGWNNGYAATFKTNTGTELNTSL